MCCKSSPRPIPFMNSDLMNKLSVLCSQALLASVGVSAGAAASGSSP